MDNPYAVGQLSRAFLTATGHEDPDTRRRADARASAWLAVLGGMASGQLTVGSRAPVRGLPAWVSLEVLRGGFATGQPAAGGRLGEDETAYAAQVGVPASRAALFAYALTGPGLAALHEQLDTGRYRMALPEEGALLIVAWLVRAGDRGAALDLLEVLEPFADRLRFLPRPTETRSLPPGHVFRRTAVEARTALADRPVNRAVETQREALAVWNPIADRFLALWWASRGADGAVGGSFAGDWPSRAANLLTAYDGLARVHARCTKHRNPKENQAVLVAATREQLAGGLTPRTAGRVRGAIVAMTAKRGTPDSDELAALRRRQATIAAQPAHRDLARVAAARLEHARQDEGLRTVDAYAVPVTEAEGAAFEVPVAATMPVSVGRALQLARAAPVEDLVADGTVPSSEALAELAPQLTAEAVATAYADPALGRLMGATYAAFRRRRTLLLLDLAKQVPFGELPWVRAARPYAADRRPDDALAVGRRMAALALDAYPGVILPNPLVAELGQLFAAGGRTLPLTEELAADIFMGRFSDKFLAAAQQAGGRLRGSLYARYYGLDYELILALAPRAETSGGRRRRRGRSGTATFGDLCIARAGAGSWSRSVAGNGTVIEQAQLMTTHNLAALVEAGVTPCRSWGDLASDAIDAMVDQLRLARTQPRPLRRVKAAAYAWRQALFFLTMAGPQATADALARTEPLRHTRQAGPVVEILGGLAHVAAGSGFAADGSCPGGRRFLGWTVGPHWVLAGRNEG